MPLSGIVGAGVSSVVGGLTSLFGAKNQNRQIDKQIRAQREENEKTRRYNLDLAKQQNQWNIDQWNRENQYNSPAAQMQRYVDAGLNPNLIYGQSNTAPQLSGSMSSGAPASPVDMSAIGNKKSMFASMMEGISSNPFAYEQLRGMRLQNDEKEQDIQSKKMDNDFVSFLRSFNPDGADITPQVEKFKNSVSGRNELAQMDKLWYELQQHQREYAVGESSYRVREIQAKIDKGVMEQIYNFARSIDVSKNDAEAFVKSMIYSAYGIKSDSAIKQAEAIWSDPSFIEKLPNGLPSLIKILRMMFGK